MRTIKINLLERLAGQATEADFLGFSKIADALTNQIITYSKHTRSDDAHYIYNETDFKKDINNCYWSMILRIADFYNISNLDAQEVQNIIEKNSNDIIKEFVKDFDHAQHGVGAFEEKVPGEINRPNIEIYEEKV